MLLVASIWYLFLTSILSIGQFYLERHYGRGTSRVTAPTLLGRIWRGIIPRHAEVPKPPSPGPGEPPEPPTTMRPHG